MIHFLKPDKLFRIYFGKLESILTFLYLCPLSKRSTFFLFFFEYFLNSNIHLYPMKFLLNS